MIVAFELEDGTVVEMEATGDPTEASVVPAGSGDRVAARAVVKLEAAIDTAGVIVERLADGLQSRLDAQELELEFSLKATATSGLIVATGGTEANFTVRAKWTKASDEG